MNIFMKRIMYSCNKATELIEKKKLVQLSLFEKMKLNIHVKMCKSCNAYSKESVIFDSIFDNLNSNFSLEKKQNEELKIRIINKLIK
jgi:hypothetical protein